MDDLEGFLKFFGTIVCVTLFVAWTGSKTLLIIFGVVVFAGFIYLTFFGGGGGDGGKDGHNF